MSKLSYWVFVRSWLYQKSFKINNDWFEKTKIIRRWSKNNWTDRICWTNKICNGIHADGAEYMFILTILEKIKETRLKFSQESVTVL